MANINWIYRCDCGTLNRVPDGVPVNICSDCKKETPRPTENKIPAAKSKAVKETAVTAEATPEAHC